MTLQEIKNEVAKALKAKCRTRVLTNWDEYVSIYGTPDWLVEKVCERYAQSELSEANKEIERLKAEVEQKSKSYIPFDAGWEGAKNFLSEKIDEAKVIEKELLQVKATLFVNFGPEQNRNAQIVTQSMNVDQMCFSVLNHYITKNQYQQQEIERLKALTDDIDPMRVYQRQEQTIKELREALTIILCHFTKEEMVEKMGSRYEKIDSLITPK